MRYLVIGGTGFIGKHLCCRLVEHGHEVRSMSRRQSADIEALGIRQFVGPISDQGLVAKALKGCDAVFHLAHSHTPAEAEKDWAGEINGNVLPLIGLINASLYEGCSIIFASSGGTVYGRPETLPIPETAPLLPISAYGISKLSSEHYLRLTNREKGLAALVFRISNPFGPGQSGLRSQGLIGALIRAARAENAIEIWGDGSIIRDYIYIDDVVRAFLAALKYSFKFDVMNIGSGVGRNINEVVASLERAINKPIPKTFKSGRKIDVEANVLHIGHARKSLSWTPNYSFEEQLLTTYRLYES